MIDYNNDGLLAVAKSADRFGSKFLKTVANENPGNLITSPLSAQVVLAMAAYGAGGTTAEQMRSALFIPSDNEFGQSGYKSLIEALNTPKGVELRLANKIYTSTVAVVKPDFQELTGTKFLSSSQEVSFDDAEGTAALINSWCEEQTNNRIKDLISPDSITPDGRLVLVNAVYFKGQWEKKFDPRFTENRPFHQDKNTSTNVPTMFISTNIRYGELADLQARFIEIPYQGRELSMLIVLPNEMDGLQTILDNIDDEKTSENLQQAYNRDVELFLPKFRIESTLNLKTTLQNLGMTEMFENCADFSGISEEPLKVSKVVQKAFIEVNEEGSEAAAATAAHLVLRCAAFNVEPPVSFVVDRPFYYAIREPLTKTPLFAGFVHQPTDA